MNRVLWEAWIVQKGPSCIEGPFYLAATTQYKLRRSRIQGCYEGVREVFKGLFQGTGKDALTIRWTMLRKIDRIDQHLDDRLGDRRCQHGHGRAARLHPRFPTPIDRALGCCPGDGMRR